MSIVAVWGALAAACLIGELMTGSLYFLVVAIAAAAAGGVSSALAPLDTNVHIVQLSVFLLGSLAGGAAVWGHRRLARPFILAEDVATILPVLRINTDGTVRVRHHEREWDAVLSPGLRHSSEANPGFVRIVGVRNRRLVCKPAT